MDSRSFFLLFIKQMVPEAISRMWKSKPAIGEKGGGWSSLFPGSHWIAGSLRAQGMNLHIPSMTAAEWQQLEHDRWAAWGMFTCVADAHHR